MRCGNVMLCQYDTHREVLSLKTLPAAKKIYVEDEWNIVTESWWIYSDRRKLSTWRKMSPTTTRSTTDLTRTALESMADLSQQEADNYMIWCKFTSVSQESEGSTFTSVRNSTLMTGECSHDWWVGKNMEGNCRRPTQRTIPALAKTEWYI
jgi:hypothetical protein